MKNLLSILLLACTLAAVPGCGDGGGSGRTTVNFWQFWDLAMVKPIIEEFERLHPDIDVKAEQLTWASGLEKIQAAVASGTQPDLCELGSTWVPRFSYEGILEDLTPLYEQIGDDYMMWGSAVWQDHVYGVPWVQGSRALFYNAALFERAGLDPEVPPATWQELLVASRRINQLGDDIYGFGLNLGERYVLYKKFMAFAWGNGGRILDGDVVVYDSPQNLEALRFYQALAQYALSEKQEVLDHSFKSGHLGMQISGAWNIKNWAVEAPELDYRVALVPRPAPGKGSHASFAGAEMLVIFKNSKQKQAALELARFLMSYQPAKTLSLQVKSVFPASKLALDDSDFTDDPRTRVFVEQALTSHTAPAHPGWIEMEDIINRSIEEVLYGRNDPPESLAAADKQLQAVVSRFK